MAGLCGCTSGCSCLLVGGDGICISGTGILPDPYVISFCGGLGICDEVMACVCANLETTGGLRGTADTPCKLGIKLDPSADQAAVLGPDGLLVRASSDPMPPSPGNCYATVEGLPAGGSQDALIWGTFQGGRDVVPYGTFQAYEHAIGLDTHINYEMSYELSGESAGIAPQSSFNPSWTNPDVGVNFNQMSLNAWKTLNVTTSQWYGMGFADQDGANHVTQILRAFAGKTVHFWEVNTPTLTGLSRNIAAFCTERSTVITSTDLANLANVNGIPTGVRLTSATLVTITPAQAVAAGCTWAILPSLATDAQIQAWTGTAGLSCLLYNTARRVDVDRAITLGVRGVLSDDLAYQQGRTQIDYTLGSWSIGTISSGQVHNLESEGLYDNGVRGQPQEGGWLLPAKYGTDPRSTRFPDVTPSGPRLAADTCGWRVLPANGSYELEWQARTLADTGRLVSKSGMFVCCPDDRDPTHYAGPDALRVQPSGYVCATRNSLTADARQGFQVLGYWNKGVYQELDVQAISATFDPNNRVFQRNVITVTPTTITYTRYLPGAASVTVTAQRVDPTEGRGGYFHMIKEEDIGAGGVGIFGAIWRDIRWKAL